MTKLRLATQGRNDPRKRVNFNFTHRPGAGLPGRDSRIKTRFITAADLMLQLGAAHRKDQLKSDFNQAILGPKLLVIDELGYLPFGREEASLLSR